MSILRCTILISLMAAQLVFGAGMFLVECRSSDGHAQVEFVHNTCHEHESPAADTIASNTLATDGSSCHDTPICHGVWLAPRKTGLRIKVGPSLAWMPTHSTRAALQSDVSRTVRTDSFDAIHPALRVVQTVVLTI